MNITWICVFILNWFYTSTFIPYSVISKFNQCLHVSFHLIFPFVCVNILCYIFDYCIIFHLMSICLLFRGEQSWHYMDLETSVMSVWIVCFRFKILPCFLRVNAWVHIHIHTHIYMYICILYAYGSYSEYLISIGVCRYLYFWYK